nr:MAG TPA: minor tail protein [Caudoviricetes sp.]
MADGSVIIDTKLDTSGMKVGSREIEAAAKRIATSVNGMGKSAEQALQKQFNAFSKLNDQYAKQEQKVESLKRKVAEYGNQKIPTQEYQEIQKQIEKAEASLGRLSDRQEKFLEMGGSRNSKAYRSMQYDIEQLTNTIEYAKGELADLEASGRAFTLGTDTSKAQEDTRRLAAETERLAGMEYQARSALDNMAASAQNYGNEAAAAGQKTSILKTILGGVKTGASKLASGIFSAAKSMLNLGKSTRGTGISLKNLIRYAFGIRSMFALMNKLRSAVVSGFQNLAQYSGTTNSSISMLISALAQLKNALATAFAPILNVVAPILTTFINMLSRAANYVAQFTAALTGKKTYTKAVGVQKDYAASLKDTAKSAKEAKKEEDNYLSSLDEVARFETNKNDDSSAGGGAGGGAGAGDMFETANIDSGLAEWADRIKEMWANAVFTELGNILGEKLRDALLQIPWGPIQAVAGKIGKSLATLLNGVIETENLGYTIGTTIGNGITTAIELAYQFVTNFHWDSLGAFVGQGINGAVQTIDLWKATYTLGAAITGMAVAAIAFAKNVDWTALGDKIAAGINGFFAGFDAGKLARAGSEIIKGLLDSIFNAVANIDSEKIWADIIDFLTNVDWLGVVVKLKSCADAIINGLTWGLIMAIINYDWIDLWNRIIDSFKSLFGINSPSKLFQEFGTYIVQGLFNGLKEKFPIVTDLMKQWCTDIKRVIDDINLVFQGIVDFITGVFTGDWERAWLGVREIFSGIFSGLADLLRAPINAVIRLINGAIGGLNVLVRGANRLPGVSIPTISNVPYLASGAVIPPRSEFLAVLGDQKHGNNIETPEALLRKIIREELGDMKGNSGGKYEFVAQLNRKTIFSQLIEEAKMQQMQTGKNPFELA